MLKNRFTPVILASFVALAFTRLGVAQTPPQKPLFARIVVSDKAALYVQIQGSELRTALSADGLKNAAPAKLDKVVGDVSWSSEFSLPIPPNQLPPDVTEVKVYVGVAQQKAQAGQPPPQTTDIHAQFTVTRKDARNAVWQHVWRASVPAGAALAGAPDIRLPDPAHAKADILVFTKVESDLKPDFLLTSYSNSKWAVFLVVRADNAFLREVRKEGRVLEAKLVAADASGNVKATKVAPLSEFWHAGTCYYITNAKGTYKFTGTADIGAASPLTATGFAVVP